MGRGRRVCILLSEADLLERERIFCIIINREEMEILILQINKQFEIKGQQLQTH